MKHLGFVQVAACAVLLFAAFSPRAVQADEWDKKTIINFSDTVQVPGATLPAGKYVFKLAESSADRYIVQIFNEREDHVYATLLAIPNYRMTIPDKTVISFYEAPSGQPEPIKAWFYPGDNLGREFVYGGAEAAMIAKTAHEVVPTEVPTQVAQSTLPVNTVEPTVASEPTDSEELTSEDVHSAEPEAAAVATEPELQSPAPPAEDSDESTAVNPAVEDQPAQDGASASPETSSLPATGSELPMVGLVGLLSIAAAFTIRSVRSSS
jgi:hypothetical protein